MSRPGTGTKALSPKDVTSAKKGSLPNEVLQAFNELIAKEWDGEEAEVQQRDVVALIASKLKIKPDAVESRWLNVEDIYRKEGWVVTYDKPGFNEMGSAVFIFKKRRTRGG